MKNKWMLLGLLAVLLLLNGFQFFLSNIEQNESKKTIESLEISNAEYYPEIYDHLDSLTIKSFEREIEDKLLVYVGRPTCIDCNIFEPELINLISDNNLSDKLKYLNIAKIRENDILWKQFKNSYNIIYTPTIAIFENGILTSKIEWTPENGISVSKVESWMRENQII